MNFQKEKLAYLVIPASEPDRKSPLRPLRAQGAFRFFREGEGKHAVGGEKPVFAGLFSRFTLPRGAPGHTRPAGTKFSAAKGRRRHAETRRRCGAGALAARGGAVTKVYIINENLRFELLDENFFDIKTAII